MPHSSAIAEVAAEHEPHPAHVLHPHRLVEAVLLAQCLARLLRDDAPGRRHLRDVGRDVVARRELDDRRRPAPRSPTASRWRPGAGARCRSALPSTGAAVGRAIIDTGRDPTLACDRSQTEAASSARGREPRHDGLAKTKRATIRTSAGARGSPTRRSRASSTASTDHARRPARGSSAPSPTLGFRPSHIARSLASRSTKTIGLVMGDVASPFFPDVVRGAEDVLSPGRLLPHPLQQPARSRARAEERHPPARAEHRRPDPRRAPVPARRSWRSWPSARASPWSS